VYQPLAGDRVRVTRRRPGGQIHFVKTGTIAAVNPTGYEFNEDHGPQHHALASCRFLAEGMPGWTQTIEPLPSP
jgi:hypothetical protein